MQNIDPKSLPAYRELDRPVVLWVGDVESSDQEQFTDRWLNVTRVEASKSIDQLAFDAQMSQARAIVLNGEQAAMDLLREHVNRLCAHGLLIVCRATTEEHRREFLTIQQRVAAATGFPHRNWLHWQVDAPVKDVAQQVALWMPGPAQNRDLSVIVLDPAGKEVELNTALDWEAQLLVRRAFSDCVSITLRPLTGGRSAMTFRVDATTKRPAPFGSPLPFVLKIDSRLKVETEYSNFWQFVEPVVPFHLRPMVDQSRSCSGLKFGVLVGSFLTDSESFLQAVQRGSGQATLYSLYDSALAGWYTNVASTDAIRTATLAERLSELFESDFTSFESIRGSAVRARGGTKTPDELLSSLRSAVPVAFRVAPSHGDLHGGNLQSRRGDAILVDFDLMKSEAPVSFDSALLEVSTAFSNVAAEADDWERATDELYELASLRRPPPAPVGLASSNWLRQMVRQIRLFALAMQVTDLEYAQVVAFCLLRYSTFCPDEDQHHNQRVKAFVVAERLIRQLMP